MGIPSFYRWLINRYPRCVIDAAEDESPTTTPNPNGFEFDNLYLDMNGIIHPCFHPQDAIPPESYDEVFQRVFMYIDRIFSIVRPRKLLFLAIDGVAPRAKMNQQRARRFRASKDLADQESATQPLLNVPETHVKEENEKLDSNVITPGTEFMELLSSSLQYYIHLRMNNDPGWKGIKVILSDASVPGEGEHKIISYIRLQRNLPGFDPNTRHCLYGLDADLIMLALATHEVHFTVLREDTHKSATVHQSRRTISRHNKSQYVERIVIGFDEYLSNQEFQIPDPNVNTDFERLIDDFVFMCIFVGNDFLPHIPSLEIGEGAIDLLMMTYKKEFVPMGGYLTMSSEVNLDPVEHFIKAIGTNEMLIFRKRNGITKARGQTEKRSHHSSANHSHSKTEEGKHVKTEDILNTDKVKLGEDGWRERYYALKFGVESAEFTQKDAVKKYVEGIRWVMHYYYQGICSWNWFYPYHYAPFASDFQGIGQLEISFDLGRPFKPFDQLMGVLPAARQLMTDPSSPILDFYPTDFEVDLNGKRHSWQGVCKLPFIDESRLLAEISKVEHTLTDPEVRRNSVGQDVLFIYQAHPLATLILSFAEDLRNNQKLPESAVRKEINPVLSGGMNGYIYIPEKAICPADIDSPINGLEIIEENKVISVFYEFPASHPHISMLPDGLIMPAKFINKDDIHPPALLWHESTAVMGSRCSQRPKPPNCISGACLAKMAHRLVSDSCGGKTHEVSELWHRWLNRKVAEDVKLRVETMVQICLGHSMWPTKGKIVKRKRDCRGESLKNHKKVKSSRGGSEITNHKIATETNKIQAGIENHGKGKERENECEITNDKIASECHGETNKTQSAIANHGQGEQRENDGAAQLNKSQKRNLRQRISRKNKRNNNEMSKVQSSVEKHDEINNVHFASESNGQRSDGETNKTQSGIENHGKGKERENECEITNDKIASEFDGETNKTQSAIANHGQGEQRENGGAVQLNRSQEKNLKRRSKMNKRNNNEMSKVQSSVENYDEINNVHFASESNGQRSDGETNKTQSGIENHGKGKERENECEITNDKIASECDGETNKTQSAIANHGQGEQRENDGAAQLNRSQEKNLKRRSKMNKRNNNEMCKVQSAVENHDEMNNVHFASESNGQRNQCKIPLKGDGEMSNMQLDFTSGETAKRKQDCGGESARNHKKVKLTRDDGEVTDDKIASLCNGETNKIQSAIENHDNGDEREKDGAVKLTKNQKATYGKKK